MTERIERTDREILNAAIALVVAWDAQADDSASRDALRKTVVAKFSMLRQTIGGLTLPGGNHTLAPSDAALVVELAKSGLSQRSVASILGSHRETVSLYIKLNKIENCPCGRPYNHRGQCHIRLTTSRLSLPIVRRLCETGRAPKIVLLNSLKPKWELPSAFQAGGNDLLLLVNGAVPNGLPEQLRGDVCQEIVLAVLSGELSQCEIPSAVSKFIKSQRKAQESQYMAISLDQPRYDGRSWHDVLASE